jgi:hypothetical protein
MNAHPEFPVALKYNTLQFAANVLMHIRGREDTEMGTIGEQMLELLSSFRRVRPEYIDEFYELLTGLCTYLIKYSGLAESCSKSGAYKARRLECLATIKTLIQGIEKQEDVMKLLRNMRR